MAGYEMRQYIQRLEHSGEIIAVAPREIAREPAVTGGRRIRLLGLLSLSLPLLIAASAINGGNTAANAAPRTACAVDRPWSPTERSEPPRSVTSDPGQRRGRGAAEVRFSRGTVRPSAPIQSLRGSVSNSP